MPTDHPHYSEITDYDLLANIMLIPSELGGCSTPVISGYRGQFFWHVNREDITGTDWIAAWYFETSEVPPGEQSQCKIMLGPLKDHLDEGGIPVNAQFGIREGARIVGVGVVLECNLPSA